MSNSNKHLVKNLFERQHASLQAFLRRRLRDKQQTKDLSQEVYLRMLRIREADLIQNPEGYLFTVAANLIKEQALGERFHQRSIDVTDDSLESDLFVDSHMEEDTDHAVRAGRLREVLAQLSPKCQAAVAMQYHDNLSYRQIGERLGVSTNMVKKYLAQALTHCRRRMARWR